MSKPGLKQAREAYEEVVRVERLVSAIAGPGTETITLAKMVEAGGILGAFAVDLDIQQLRVVSTCIGFVRQYTKTHRKRDAKEA